MYKYNLKRTLMENLCSSYIDIITAVESKTETNIFMQFSIRN